MSTTMLLIEKSGTVKEITVKLSEIHNLYKKAGFSTAENFIEHYVWDIDGEANPTNSLDKPLEGLPKKYSISLWGKKKGKNAKNVYQFPPPLEETTDFCGNVILMNHKGQQNITIAEWNHIYDVLCEQVIHSTIEYDDDDAVAEEEDNEEEEEEDNDDNEEEEDEEDEITAYTTAPKHKKKNSEPIASEFIFGVEDTYLDCSAELQTEEYVV